MATQKGIRAGAAYVELFADDSRLMRGLKRAEQRLKAFGSAMRNIGTRMAGMGAAIVAPMLGATKAFASAGDALDKMSARTGVSVESLSELGFAAEQSGADLNALGDALFRMRRRLANAATGSGPAVRALEALGLSADELTKLTPEDQFKALAHALSNVENKSLAAQYAFEIFGGGAKSLLPLLFAGADGIEELQKQARALGLTISTEAAEEAALLTDTLNILWRVIKQGVFHIGASLAPLITLLTKRIALAAVVINDWIKRNKALIVTVFKIVAAVVGAGIALITLGLLVTGLGVAFGILAKVAAAAGAAIALAAKVLAAIVSPIGLLIGLVVLLGGAILYATGAGGKALAWLGERFRSLGEIAGETFAGMKDAMAGGDFVLAARVLWAGLRAAWESGIAPIRAAWNEFRFAFERIAIEGFSAARKAWINTRDWFERNFPEFTANIAKAWTNVAATVQKVWARVTNWLSDRFLDVMGMLDETLDVEAAKRLGRQELDRDLADIEGHRQAGVAEAERRRDRSDAQRKAEKREDLDAVERDRLDAIERLNDEHAKRVEEAARKLEEAREELTRAREQARERREQRGEDGLSLPERFKGDLSDLLDGIGEAIGAAARQIEVRGTFNAAAIQGLAAGGNAAERTAKATEQTAKHTKRIAQSTRNKSGSVFT